MIAVRSIPASYTLQSLVIMTSRPLPIPHTHHSIEGYGQTGPYKRAPGYDVVIEGEGTLTYALGIRPQLLTQPRQRD